MGQSLIKDNRAGDIALKISIVVVSIAIIVILCVVFTGKNKSSDDDKKDVDEDQNEDIIIDNDGGSSISNVDNDLNTAFSFNLPRCSSNKDCDNQMCGTMEYTWGGTTDEGNYATVTLTWDGVCAPTLP